MYSSACVSWKTEWTVYKPYLRKTHYNHWALKLCKPLWKNVFGDNNSPGTYSNTISSLCFLCLTTNPNFTIWLSKKNICELKAIGRMMWTTHCSYMRQWVPSLITLLLQFVGFLNSNQLWQNFLSLLGSRNYLFCFEIKIQSLRENVSNVRKQIHT